MALSRAGSAQGTLTVTMTVVTSTGVMMEPDGEPQIVAANAVDPKDNVSHLDPVWHGRFVSTPEYRNRGPEEQRSRYFGLADNLRFSRSVFELAGLLLLWPW